MNERWPFVRAIDEGLTRWPIYVINSAGNAKLLGYDDKPVVVHCFEVLHLYK